MFTCCSTLFRRMRQECISSLSLSAREEKEEEEEEEESLFKADAVN